MKISKLEKKRKIAGYFFLIPSFIFLATFLLYPLIKSIAMSFTDWNGFNPEYKWVGIKNYVKLFTDTPAYWSSIKINLTFSFVSTLIQTVLGFFLAFAVYHMSSKWQNFYKVALYIPVILPASVIAVMWRFMLSPDTGLVNTILRLVGLDFLCHAWVGENATALGTIIAVNTWQYVGFTMVLYYIAMQNIPLDVLESAEIDGAGKWQRLRYFFLPLTAGTTETNVILSITGGMKSFALFYMLTGGGPGTATRVVSMLIYNTAFVDYKFYKALTMSTILFLIILVLVLFSRWLGSRHSDMG